MITLNCCLLIVLLFTSFIFIPFEAIKCKNEAGQSVDWYLAYKLPKDNENGDNQNGFTYAFITSKESEGWKLSKQLVNNEKSIWGKTLSPLYENHIDYTHLSWNDDPPHTEGNGYYAHSKGVLAMDSKSGFWLIHSVPNFPPLFNETYDYPETGQENGQLSMCISFSSQAEGPKIGHHLTYLRPNVYDYNIIETIPRDNEYFQNLKPSSKRRVKGETEILKTKITATDETIDEFLVFSKPPKVLTEVYSKEISPTLESDLYVQSWRRGAGGVLSSTCPKDKVEDAINIKSLTMNFNDRDSISASWQFTSDHSKWAITNSEATSKHWICIGDINRMRSQSKRGGGVVCMKNQQVWSLFKSLIKEIETCRSSS